MQVMRTASVGAVMAVCGAVALGQPGGREVRLTVREGTSMAAALSEERGTLEDVVEPYLIQQGFLVRTARGRMATHRAYRHLGLKPKVAPVDLFAEQPDNE